jgi:hypothetical protein
VVEDKSVSRLHATVSFESAADTTLSIRDASRYGTTLNGRPVSRDVPTQVAPGDDVVIGTTRLMIERVALRFCFASSSQQHDTDLDSAREHATRVGEVTGDTAAMTHLVAPARATPVTTRLLAALVRCVSVVTPAWVRRIAADDGRAIAGGLPDPDTSEVPATIEGEFSGVSLAPNAARSKVFAGLAVVFLEMA